MGLATSPTSGKLRYLDETSQTTGYAPRCYIRIPSRIVSSANANTNMIRMYILPDVSDTKSASYANEPVPGRSSPIKTYSHSEDRQIGVQLHFVTDCYDRIWENLVYLRMLQSAVYPQYLSTTVPYYPPPVCKIVVGQLLGACPLSVVLRSYSVRYPTDVAWDEMTFLPAKFDVDTNWDVVFRPTDLPGQERILMDLRGAEDAASVCYKNYIQGARGYNKDIMPNCSSSDSLSSCWGMRPSSASPSQSPPAPISAAPSAPAGSIGAAAGPIGIPGMIGD